MSWSWLDQLRSVIVFQFKLDISAGSYNNNNKIIWSLEMESNVLKLLFIKQEKHLGQGTCTNIYSGELKLRNEDDDDGLSGHEVVDVVLKVLTAGHISVSSTTSIDTHSR